MKYKAIDLFSINTRPTKRELFRLALTYDVPSTLEKEPSVQTYTYKDKHVLEITIYETHNKGTDYAYRDTWCIRIILHDKHIMIETVYPPTFPFDQLDTYTEQQEKTKDLLIERLTQSFIVHKYIKKEPPYVEK